jgi:hypothetical protein
MNASSTSGNSGFLKRIAAILGRVELRRALSKADEELIYRLRYMAQVRAEGPDRTADGRLVADGYDGSINYYNMMMFFDGEFVSTFRIDAAFGKNAISPSLALFGDVLAPLLRQGRVVLNLNRIAVAPNCALALPELPYLVIRAAWLAAEHFEADILTMTCGAEDQATYARMFGFEALGSPRSPSPSGPVIACIALDCRANRRRLESRYPFFRSREAELLSVFGRLAPVEPMGADVARSGPLVQAPPSIARSFVASP